MPATIDRAPARAATRIPALDFTKGTLVLFMVLYHWLNYFVAPDGDMYRYLRFLTPSFIFITGFLISHVYLARYDHTDPRLMRRLLQRGLKLLAIFAALNLAIGLLLADSYNGRILFAQLSVRNLVAIYVTGNVWVADKGKAAAFFILVPISYLLLLSAVLVRMSQRYRYSFHVACAAILIAIAVLSVYDVKSPNLELLAIGLLGVLSGYTPIDRLNDCISRPVPLVLAYLCYVVAITLWNVTYPLQLVGVYLTLLIIYLLGASEAEPGRMRRHVILLGKYSLFGYIATIAILQVLHRSLRHAGSGMVALGITFVAAFVLTMVSVEIVDRMRNRTATVDRLYKAMFA